MDINAEVDTAWYASVQPIPDWTSSPVDKPSFEVFFPARSD